DRSRVRPAEGRCRPYGAKSGARINAGDISYPDRDGNRRRPDWNRDSCQLGAPRRQRHWPVSAGCGSRRQTARNLARAISWPAPSGDPGQHWLSRSGAEMGQVVAAARTLGLDVIKLEIRRAENIVPALEAQKDRAEALYITSDALLNSNRIRINTLSNVAGLPSVSGTRDFVEAGGLIAYGPNFADLFRRA